MVRAEALKAEVLRRLAGVEGVVGVGIGVGGIRVYCRDGASVDRVIVALPGVEVVIEVVGEIRAGEEVQRDRPLDTHE